MAGAAYAEVNLSPQGSASTESEPTARVGGRLRLVVLVLAAVVIVSLGWQWMNSLPVPLSADNGTFGSPFDVGTSIHIGVFAPTDAEVQLERAEARLLPGSVPASVGVSVCHQADGHGVIGSANGPLPEGACEPLAAFDGQPLRKDDYLLISVVPLSPGTVQLELATAARDGLRRGSKIVELPPIPAK